MVSQEWTNTCKFKNYVRVISYSYSLKCVQCIVVIGFEGTYPTPGAGARSRCSKASFYNIESHGSSCSCPSSSTCPSRENVRGGSSCPEADHGAPPASISSQDLCKPDHTISQLGFFDHIISIKDRNHSSENKLVSFLLVHTSYI